MKHRIALFLLVFASVAPAYALPGLDGKAQALASRFHSIQERQKQDILNGSYIYHPNWPSTQAPELYMYLGNRELKAEDVVVALLEFNQYKTFQPGIKKSQLVNQPSPREAIVDFTLETSRGGPTEDYTLRYQIQTTGGASPAERNYRIDFTLTQRAAHLTKLEGVVLVENYGGGVVVQHYYYSEVEGTPLAENDVLPKLRASIESTFRFTRTLKRGASFPQKLESLRRLF